MAIPRIFQPILPQDTSITKIRGHKRFNISNASTYPVWSMRYSNKITPIGTPQAENDPRNQDGTYQHICWKKFYNTYYKYPYGHSKTLEHYNSNYTYKFLNYSSSAILIPYMDYGESIKPGTVHLTYNNIELNDDGYGNLYDSKIDTTNFTNRSNLLGYWGFNDSFNSISISSLNDVEYSSGSYYNYNVSKTYIAYNSNITGVPDMAFCQNIRLSKGVEINNKPSGCAAYFTKFEETFNSSGKKLKQFNSDSYIISEHKSEYIFDKDFTISFWIKNFELTESVNYSPFINKSIFKNVNKYGSQSGYINDTLYDNKLSMSSSYTLDNSDVFPFKFDFDNYFIRFSRSNGINSINMTGTTNVVEHSGEWIHVAVVKNNNDYILYENGVESAKITSKIKDCHNENALCFGLFNGGLDEIRIYDSACSPEQIKSLAKSSNQSLYQTNVCGNIFYKTGNVIISGFDNKYNTLPESDWILDFKGTHTIYQRNLFIRIDKGSFNLSQNPTARENYKSDLLIADFVTGSLYPYVTTIGFYDDSKNLLAVAKLNEPLNMRDDVIINISVRFDV